MPANDQYWRDLPQMHKVFAGSAIVLLLATLLMMYKDESRSWREYQREAEDLKVEQLEEGLEQFESEEFKSQISAVEEKIAAADSDLAGKQDEISKLESEMKTQQGVVQKLATESKSKNAFRDKARADYDLRVRDEEPAVVQREYLQIFENAQEAASEYALKYEQAEQAYDALKQQLDALNQDKTVAQSELNRLEGDRKALQEQLESLRPSNPAIAAKRAFKEWPIINGFNPHLQIKYDWPSDLEQELGMVSVGRVDRCRTCHVNAVSFGAGNVPNYPDDKYHQPFSSHPNPDLFLSSTSPHPVEKFGCTVCHQGDGSGTSFQNAEHSPPNPAVAHEWEEEHHWHSNHFWEYPMLPEMFEESGCIKCHHNVVELGINKEFGNTAPKVFEGYNLIREYGCFGCHEINGYDGTEQIGPDLRLEPNTPEQLAKIEADPNQVAGDMRKVGPSLRHIASKTTPEFVAYWTEDPQRFRPSTRMPRFFNNTNQHDAMADVLQPVELAALGIYLDSKSEAMELLAPKEGYQANAERGKDLFSKRGCLACHQRGGEEFEGIEATFGPDISKIHEKVKPGPDGFKWLYTWIKEPTRYHTRTKMPDLYLNPEGEGENYVDPAADIAAYLLEGEYGDFPELTSPKPYLGIALDSNFTLEEAQGIGITEENFAGVRVTEVIQGSPAVRVQKDGVDFPIEYSDVITNLNGQAVTSPEEFSKIEAGLANGSETKLTLIRDGVTHQVTTVITTPLDDLVRLYLSKALPSSKVEEAFAERHFPVTAEMYGEDGNIKSDAIRGDEIELAPKSIDEEVSDEEWQRRQMVYIGRRTISRYGCYACHDIPGFEDARPIGAALQDWGRKDTSKLAFEHVHEWLHHHGDPDGGSTAERLEQAVANAKHGSEISEDTLEEAALYESVLHHGRAGFIWQKLRQPRSYDYKKTETKGWDERLRMPKFPFNQEEIESVAAFVLGLVADPPPPEYRYNPDGDKGAIIEGERLLTKYNCAGCHMLEIPEWEFAADPDEIFAPELEEGEEKALDLLAHIKGIDSHWTGEENEDGIPILKAKGYPQRSPDPEEDLEFQMYSFVLWDPIKVDDDVTLMPGQPLPVAVTKIKSQGEGRGGDLANWLIPRLVGNEPGVTNINESWQAAPPPLEGEGHKVQTPWLYQFLKNPEQLRYTTVLRMPKFNMDDDEALALANYFAAIDGVPYPYQPIPPKQREVQIAESLAYQEHYPNAEMDYLTASWNVLNDSTLCQKCHSVGGMMVTETDPTKVKRGPNLQRVEKRLRPDWAQLWVYHPQWITPYTSMPVNFPVNKESARTELFGGNNVRQAQGAVDALFNYAELLEIHGQTSYGADAPATEEAAE